ncbi:transcriptional regulator, HxlR family [Parabacteroides johnsonii DSM 18315]|jgi:DNA-binding HxlR family transcriptional regulator|uniref:Transcriptional regulator, HxlR family n=1 Tax=Parabacteroides johnsonii DSM 18315 TaxID=537006 RepID=B7B723_9BACT|nr:helix-turn-helix domain-containing protein [Parabacteroides johnsonii]EEC97767.1 transcriptional regulator, HxlR family [Parabacteroides johnsonii DSM 18315]
MINLSLSDYQKNTLSLHKKTMYERKIPINLGCGIEVTMNVIGGKWKPWLINRLREGHHRPIDIQRAIPIADKRVLTQQLNELENMGIVHKIIYPVIPAKVEYFLTDLGESLLPIIDLMEEWGRNHRDILESSL